MKSDYSFKEQERYQQKQEDKAMRKWAKTASEYSNMLVNICYPHRYANKDSLYGENQIRVLMDKMGDFASRWPKPSMLFNIDVNNRNRTTENIINFYRTQFGMQLSQYIKHLIDIHDMMSYDELRKLPCVNISECLDFDIEAAGYIKFSKENLADLKNMGISAFIPNLDDYCIKMSSHGYLKIHCLDRTKNSITFTYQTYGGDKNDWMLFSEMTLQLDFHDVDDEKLPVDVNIIEFKSYDKIITQRIDDMNWSERQICLWCDMFSTVPYSEAICVRLQVPEFEDSSAHYTSETYLPTLNDMSRTTQIQAKIIANTETEIDRELANESTDLHYILKYLAFINLTLNNYVRIEKYDGKKPDGENILFVKSVQTDTGDTKHILCINNIKITTKQLTDLYLPPKLKGKLL